ncbi:MAG: SGNH/GDSL hydrolase family protein [Candidatus Izemoplasmataceae bacterium]
MKILFLGDSITEGVPGVSYVDLIKKETTYECINRGKGGDTVSSLLRRVRRMSDLSEYDKVVLFAGVNDVFGKLTTIYKVFKQLRKQKWAKNTGEFEKTYRELLDYLLSYNKNVVLIPPLLIGEDIHNRHNKELKELVNKIHTLSNKYTLDYIDTYKEFVEYLKDKEVSNYLPVSLLQVYQDTKIKDIALIDQISHERGLFLTLDGVHLNSKGASIVAGSIIDYVKNAKTD